MKSMLQILFFIFTIIVSECKNASPCSVIDSSCNPLSSIFLEKQILSSKNGLSFSPPGGTYKFDQFVTITSGSATSVIRYTVDGSEPSCTKGFIFTTPIPIIGAKVQTLKAATCSNTLVASKKSEDYTVTVSPLMAPNLRFWYSADSIGTQNGLEVKVWNDYSGNENHLYPSSISLSNPTLVVNALNGRPSVRLSSSQRHFLNTKMMNSYSGNKAGTGILLLRKYISQPDEVYFSIGFFGRPVNARNWRGNAINPSICSTLQPSPSICAGSAITSIPTSGYHMIAFTGDANGNIRYFYDGANDGTATLPTAATFSPANTMYLGSGINTLNFLDAEILELLFFEQNFDTNGMNAVHCYMQDKYGIQVGTSCP